MRPAPEIIQQLSSEGKLPTCLIKETWREPNEVMTYRLAVDEGTILDTILRGHEELAKFPKGWLERSLSGNRNWHGSLDLEEGETEDESPVRLICPIVVTPRYEYLTVMEQTDAVEVLKTMAGAIEHLQAMSDHGLVHRNIHPGNVLYRTPNSLLTGEMVRELEAYARDNAESRACLKNAATERLRELDEVFATAPITERGDPNEAGSQ